MRLPVSRRNLLLAALPVPAWANDGAPLPIFDAHLHYSHDAWDRLPPAQAVAPGTETGAAITTSSYPALAIRWVA
mgnify:CR=1 FL=1